MGQMMHGRYWSKRLVILALFMVVVLFPVLALNEVGKGHRSGEYGAYELGCGDSEGKLGCHGKMPSSDIAGDLDFPYEYDRGGEYTLEIKITGDPQDAPSGPEGGFNLKVSHGSLGLPVFFLVTAASVEVPHPVEGVVNRPHPFAWLSDRRRWESGSIGAGVTG